MWNAIADTPEEAANLRVRSDLMDKIAAIVEEKGWTQLEAAGHCGVTQPRVNDIEIKVKPTAESVGHLMLAVA